MDPASVAPRSDADSDHPPAIATAHLARFEFSDEGTKILMVEWLSEADVDPAKHVDDAAELHSGGEVKPDAPGTQQVNGPKDDAGWEVSWPGKSTLLPARDGDQDSSKHRVYFLLPQDVPIPPTVTIARQGRSSLIVKPLPAIFPPGFDAESGSRGVLHTLWAKKRLRELDREMDAEMRANAESIGLQMAFSEKQWIIETFLKPPASSSLVLPSSPRSPISGRLGEKLKGLRLATSPNDLLPSPTANTFTGLDAPSLTLSPHRDDIAIPSFASPPMSLNAAANGDLPAQPSDQADTEDELFALPISPRSPDMKRSQFSFL